MPNFSFKAIDKKVKKVSTTINRNGYEIVEKNAIGIVYITPDFSYYVVIKNKTYYFTINSFNCYHKRYIYAQFLDENNQRVCIVRSFNEALKCNSLYFLPFTIGSVVIGNIVYNSVTNTNMFNFKKIVHEYMHPKSHEAIELWRLNKDALAKAREKRIINSYVE